MPLMKNKNLIKRESISSCLLWKSLSEMHWISGLTLVKLQPIHPRPAITFDRDTQTVCPNISHTSFDIAYQKTVFFRFENFPTDCHWCFSLGWCRLIWEYLLDSFVEMFGLYGETLLENFAIYDTYSGIWIAPTETINSLMYLLCIRV